MIGANESEATPAKFVKLRSEIIIADEDPSDVEVHFLLLPSIPSSLSGGDTLKIGSQGKDSA